MSRSSLLVPAARRRLAILFLAALPAAALAQATLHCELSQGDTQRSIDTTPVADPYSVKGVDISRDFRFKAVVVGDAGQIAYIKLYTYVRSGGKSSLLHQASYAAPIAPGALGGIDRLYAPGLGRELMVRCTLIEVAS
jgi:hypothetical protein